MTVQDLEQELLKLSPGEKLRIIQVLLQSLSSLWETIIPPPKKVAPFMRFAGIAGNEADLLMDLEAEVEHNRTLDQDRHLNL